MISEYLKSMFRIQSASPQDEKRPTVEVATYIPPEATPLDHALLEDLIDREVAIFISTGIPVELTIALVHPSLDPSQVSRNMDCHLTTRHELIPREVQQDQLQPPASANTQGTVPSGQQAPSFIAPTPTNVDSPDTKHRVQLLWDEVLAIRPDFNQEKLRKTFETHYAREPFADKRSFHVTKAEIDIINNIRDAKGEKLIRRQRVRRGRRVI